MTLAPLVHCSGCAACADTCPKHAITMCQDAEGFLYPRIDKGSCVDCGLCTRTCPSLNRPLPRRPLAVYAANAKDKELRLASSSGGVFSILARKTFAQGGKVFGAAFDKKDWSVQHVAIKDESALAELRGSKYVQSRTVGIYKEARVALEGNIPVLFSGTPCQVAALLAYLKCTISKSTFSTLTSKLTTVDVVCHGVPSPLVWDKYLESRTAAQDGGRGSAQVDGRNIRRISFRHKNCGWKRYSLSLRFANDKEYLACHREDPFMQAFLHELCNRPSCHDCQVRGLRSGSDLTLADFWGGERVMPELDDDCGTSLVLANTMKGAELLCEIGSQVEMREVDFSAAIAGNSAVVRSPRPHRNRARFMRGFRIEDFNGIVGRMLRPSVVVRVRTVLGGIFRRLGICK